MDSKPPPDSELEAFILNTHRLSANLGERGPFQKLNLTVSEWAVLKTLQKQSPMPLQQLVARLGVSRQRLGKLLSGLEERKLVSVAVETAGDRRQRLVSTTDAAADLLSQVSTEIAAAAPDLKEAGLKSANRKAVELTRALRQSSKKNKQPDSPSS